MNEHKEEIRKAAEVAQFRFGIIAPVIQNLYPDASRTKSQEDFPELGIKTYPVNWPIGCGKEFKGVYDRDKKHIISFEENGGKHQVAATEVDLSDPSLDELITPWLHETLSEDIELLDGASYEFDIEAVRRGELSPVFFGSALTNFGVEPFLENFLEMTTSPTARMSSEGIIDPFDPTFSAFVFKIQANMNKAHRDRITFLRVCSGKFDKEMDVLHVQGNKKMRLSQPQQIMAQEREIIDEAYALVPDEGIKQDYGQEAISTLLKRTIPQNSISSVTTMLTTRERKCRRYWKKLTTG